MHAHSHEYIYRVTLNALRFDDDPSKELYEIMLEDILMDIIYELSPYHRDLKEKKDGILQAFNDYIHPPFRMAITEEAISKAV